MTQMEWYCEFINFLKEHKALMKFRYNVMRHRECSLRQVQKLLLADEWSCGWIIVYFSWGDSNEGVEYWNKLHQEWGNRYFSIKKQDVVEIL